MAGELIGNKIAETIVKPKLLPDVNSGNVEEIVTLTKKRQKNTKGIKAGTLKRYTSKYLNC